MQYPSALIIIAIIQIVKKDIQMDNSDEGLILAQKFRILKKIGSGSFGYIYTCQTLNKKQKYAVKIEKKEKGDGQLQYEIKLYQTFQGIAGIARLHDYGYEGQKIFMVIDLLQNSLQDLFESNNRKFSLSTVYQIGIQIINRLQAIHRKGFVHRDIKANNFMVGKGDKRNIVYIIDFGLAKRYRDPKTGTHIPFKEGKSLVGTARYASIASHLGYEQGRKDDLESLGFMLLYFLRGKLPWQGVQLKNKTQKYAQIGRIKKQTSIEHLCKALGDGAGNYLISIGPTDALARYFVYVRSLLFAEEPKYDLVKKILREELVRLGEQERQLDWMVVGGNGGNGEKM